MEIWVQAIAENYKMVGFLLFINQPINNLKKRIQVTPPERDETGGHLISSAKPTPDQEAGIVAGETWERGLLDILGAKGSVGAGVGGS